MNIVLTISPLGFSSRHHDMQYRWLISTRGNDVFQLISLWILTVLHLSTSMSSKACPEVSQSLVGFSHAASTVDCGDPNNATSEVIVQYTSTRVSSVILYQCRQSGFAPSSSSAVCMESGRWSPDPSQVVCRMVTTSMPLPTGRVLWFDSLKFLIEPFRMAVDHLWDKWSQWSSQSSDSQFSDVLKITPVCISANKDISAPPIALTLT